MVGDRGRGIVSVDILVGISVTNASVSIFFFLSEHSEKHVNASAGLKFS